MKMLYILVIQSVLTTVYRPFIVKDHDELIL